ncbi:tRNA pseudouridine(55) synthase TruB [Mycoplasmoides pirum]|uniref:tRNA pseudouridine(55) synthase TruB n=1 Tax=Mycoplasmoides pirum TaxID=2122 RepID=UPI0004897C1C|nr:tRNA pseudouridine(55) synthase TruB [Mycoplasmoides pirum]
MNFQNSVINFYKPSGVGSTEFLNILKKKFNWKKAGFAGTLDPMASGVLLIGVNESTKLLKNLSNLNKQYYVEILFGVETDTGDITGKIIKESSNLFFDKDEIISKLKNFVDNQYLQIPPKFSAINVNGVRAYKLARNNIEFNLKPREVKLYNWKVIDFKLPILSLMVDVSKGFYIRQLAIDLALELNTFATCKKILRTKCGDYNLKNSLFLSI